MGLSLRGMVAGRVGCSSTQAFDEEAVRQLVEGVLESASLNEAEEQDEIAAGDETYPTLEEPESDLASMTAERKIEACLAMERAAQASDERIRQMQGSYVSTSTHRRWLKNSYGLDLTSGGQHLVAVCIPIAKDGEATSTGVDLAVCHRQSELDPEVLGRSAAAKAVSLLHAEPVPSGSYHVILDRDAMTDLLATFCGSFSAENAQQKLSLLAGKEGTRVASEAVTIMDDPLLPGGPASCTFDGEGSATRTKALVEDGVLVTLLHSRKTARRQGVKTTGNAVRAGYSSTIRVGPTNLFLRPGDRAPEELIAAVGEGLFITDVSGLHCGAHPISGDFSLPCKGFLIERGRKARPVERVTVAGNFYRLLESVREVANDLRFNGNSIASPTVDVGELTIAGT